MESNEKMRSPLTESKYLNTDNTDRYRTIMRLFYENYEKLQYWLGEEEVYAALSEDPYFAGYTQELCGQDLRVLKEWNNLMAMQDTKRVRTVEEFTHRKFRYRITETGREVERLLVRLENLHLEGSSLEPSLLDRMRQSLEKLESMASCSEEEVYVWWLDLNNDFTRLNENYQDYLGSLNDVKAEELMKTEAFLLFKDRLVEYLQSFIKSIQRNAGPIESTLKNMHADIVESVLRTVTEHKLKEPLMGQELTYQQVAENSRGIYESIYGWFTGEDSEVKRLYDATNEIIRRITRMAAELSEKNGRGAGRKDEYRKVCSVFLNCRDIKEAHGLSSLVFGLNCPMHLKAESPRETDSIYSGVYEERPYEYLLYARKRGRKPAGPRLGMRDSSEERARIAEEYLKQKAEQEETLRSLEKDGRISFGSLPVIEPEIRNVLLDRISNALESADHMGRTEEGRTYRVDMNPLETCVVQCTDGWFTMPETEMIFEDKA